MNRGYIRVWRNIEDSGIMDSPEICRMFLFLLLRASSKPRNQIIGNRVVALEPGQAVIGRKKLADSLGTTEAKVRSCLDALQKMSIIDQRATNKFSLISFVNWRKYQHAPSGDSQQPAINGPTANQQTATNNNEEEFKNSSLIPPAIPVTSSLATGGEQDGGRGERALPFEFLELRRHYDEHARPESPFAGLPEYRQCKAARIWPGLTPVLDAIDVQAATEERWRRGYAPGLARFLRERLWQRVAPQTVHAAGPGFREGGQNGFAARQFAGPRDRTITSNLSTAAKVLADRKGDNQ